MTTDTSQLARITRAFAATSLPILAAAPLVHAQSSDAETRSQTLEEVVVTARQREERLQDVPIAATAFGRRDIESAGIERPGDFLALTPNVSLAEAQNVGSSFLTIRGITQVRNGESPVAVVVDDVLQVSPNQFNQDLFDIERIEVLKGPQGALYGRNAIGGAINIVTRAPATQLEGFAKLGAGNGELKKAQVGVSGPLSERIRYRFAASYLDRDGYIENVFRNDKVDFLEDTSARLRVVADLTERATADFRASLSRTDGGALNYVFQPLYGINDASDTSIPIDANNRSRNERGIDQLAMKLDFEVPVGVLTLTSSWDRVEEYADGDQFPYSRAISATSPFGPNFGDGTQTQYLDVEAFSQEIRLTSPSEKRLRWIVGAYYLATDRYISTTTGLDLGQGILRVERAPHPMTSSNPTVTFLADDNDNTAWAIFGQVNYDLTPQWELGLALRYDKDEREQTNRSLPSFDPNAGEVRDAKFDELQPRISLTWKPSEDFTAYGSYSKGFRSGGFNQSGVGAAAALVGLEGVSDLFAPETSKTFEIGAKSQLAGDTVRIAGSVFRTVTENAHYFSFVGALGAQVLTNIDEVQLEGFELEAQAIVTDDLTVYFAYGYTDSEIERHSLIPTDRGNKAPYVPRYTANAGFEYRAPLGSYVRGFLRADYERRGDQYWEPSNLTPRRTIDFVNARLGIEAVSGRWSATLWGRNLNDEEYNSEWVLGGFAHPGTPRTYGIDVRVNFGQ